jgi:hypothetical protein
MAFVIDEDRAMKRSEIDLDVSFRVLFTEELQSLFNVCRKLLFHNVDARVKAGSDKSKMEISRSATFRDVSAR